MPTVSIPPELWNAFLQTGFAGLFIWLLNRTQRRQDSREDKMMEQLAKFADSMPRLVEAISELPKMADSVARLAEAVEKVEERVDAIERNGRKSS